MIADSRKNEFIALQCQGPALRHGKQAGPDQRSNCLGRFQVSRLEMFQVELAFSKNQKYPPFLPWFTVLGGVTTAHPQNQDSLLSLGWLCLSTLRSQIGRLHFLWFLESTPPLYPHQPCLGLRKNYFPLDTLQVSCHCPAVSSFSASSPTIAKFILLIGMMWIYGKHKHGQDTLLLNIF